MARETRKLKRAQSTAPSAGKAAREAGKPGVQRGEMADPLGQGQLRALLMRLGLIVVGIWIVFGSIAMFVDSPWNKVLLGVPVVLKGAGVAVLIWKLRQDKKERGVESILSKV